MCIDAPRQWKPQEIKDFLRKTFIEEKKPRCVPGGRLDTCMYAPQQGDQVGCAFGCLLTLEHARYLDRAHLGESADQILMSEAEKTKEILSLYFIEENAPSQGWPLFLKKCQIFHDNYQQLEYEEKSGYLDSIPV